MMCRNKTRTATRIRDFSGVLAELEAADRFVLTTHTGPDGDAIGSMLGLRHLLEALGKTDVMCVCHDPVPRPCAWLPGADAVGRPDGLIDADLVVILDVAQWDRIGDAASCAPADARVLVLDHHLEEHPCGDCFFIDASYAAAGEIVAELFIAAGLPFTYEAAACLYVAQTTDTGGYRFSNTTPRSHRIAAALLETGLDVFEINYRVSDELSPAKAELLTRVLERRRSAAGGKAAYSELYAADAAEVGARDEDYNQLVNYMRNLQGVHVGILFRELDAATTKISFRSHGAFNSAAFLQRLGGGGHAAAAGATVNRPLAETRALVLRLLPDILEEHA